MTLQSSFKWMTQWRKSFFKSNNQQLSGLFLDIRRTFYGRFSDVPGLFQHDSCTVLDNVLGVFRMFSKYIRAFFKGPKISKSFTTNFSEIYTSRLPKLQIVPYCEEDEGISRSDRCWLISLLLLLRRRFTDNDVRNRVQVTFTQTTLIL